MGEFTRLIEQGADAHGVPIDALWSAAYAELKVLAHSRLYRDGQSTLLDHRQGQGSMTYGGRFGADMKLGMLFSATVVGVLSPVGGTRRVQVAIAVWFLMATTKVHGIAPTLHSAQRWWEAWLG